MLTFKASHGKRRRDATASLARSAYELSIFRLVLLSFANPVSDDVANALNLPVTQFPALHTEIEGNRPQSVCGVISDPLGTVPRHRYAKSRSSAASCVQSSASF
jgi:hypothetical protein